MRKNQKWDANWQSRIQSFGKLLPEAKNKQVESLLKEGDALHTGQTELNKAIRQIKQEQKSLSNVFLYHQQAQEELTRLNTHSATHTPREKNFLGTGTTKWQTEGWLKKAQDHFTPSSGTLDNLYSVKIATTDYQTTEEQIIQTIACVVKALHKVDAADFEAKYNASVSDTAKQAQVKAYLKEIQDQGAEVIVGSSKDHEGNPKQPSYDFSHNYHKGKFSDNGTWQPSASDYTQPTFHYQHFFQFIALTYNQPFLSTLDKDKQKGVEQSTNWQISLKGAAYTADQLKDYGIKIDSSKTTLYRTSESEKTTFPVQEGIKGWLELAHAISSDKNKLMAAFTNSPTQQLLSDLNTWSQVDGFVTDGTNYTLPEDIDSLKVVLAELEADKLVASTKKVNLADQISKKNGELKTKVAELKTKETELDKLIAEILTLKREELKKYSLANGFKDQHKRTQFELTQIRTVLENIRYLENGGDSTQPSSVSQENTAYTQITALQDKLKKYGEFWLVDYFKDLAYKSSEEKPDINQALDRIKAGKYTRADDSEDTIYESLKTFYQHFEAKANLVKLNDWEQKAMTAIKAAVEKKDEPEKLPDWQSKLKALDPLITETVMTQAKMEDFQKHNQFKNIDTVESLFKKVFDNPNQTDSSRKVKADFVEMLKKEEAEVTDLAKMLTKWEAEKIIKLISYFDYEKNLTEDKQKEYRRKYSWDREEKLEGKYVAEEGDYSLPEDKKADFQKFLYEIATGAKSLSSITKPQETPQPQKEPKGHLATYWWAYSLLALLAVAGGLVYYFRDKIWPKEEESEEE